MTMPTDQHPHAGAEGESGGAGLSEALERMPKNWSAWRSWLNTVMAEGECRTYEYQSARLDAHAADLEKWTSALSASSTSADAGWADITEAELRRELKAENGFAPLERWIEGLNAIARRRVGAQTTGGAGLTAEEAAARAVAAWHTSVSRVDRDWPDKFDAAQYRSIARAALNAARATAATAPAGGGDPYAHLRGKRWDHGGEIMPGSADAPAKPGEGDEGALETMRDLLRAAYIEGCEAVHVAIHDDPSLELMNVQDAEFGEAADDYAMSAKVKKDRSPGTFYLDPEGDIHLVPEITPPADAALRFKEASNAAYQEMRSQGFSGGWDHDALVDAVLTALTPSAPPSPADGAPSETGEADR